MPSLRWTLYRLRSMPLAELPHRLRERVRRERDRRELHVPSLSDTLRSQPLPALPVDLRLLSRAATPSHRARLERDVRALLAEDFTLLGVRRHGAGTRTHWHLDPEHGDLWDASVFAFDVDIQAAGAHRDPKLPWELMRLHTVQLLALGAAVLDGDLADDARRAALGDWESWLTDNPPYRGLAYAAGIECAARVASWLVVAGLLGPDLPESLRRATWDALAAHAHWLHRYPSLHSSANNHYIAEIAALFCLGALAPDLPGASRYRDDARDALAREAQHQIHPDGVGGEQSPTYQAYSMEWLLLARQVGLATGVPLPPAVDERLAAGAHFLANLHDRNGHAPHIGDDDEGVVVRRQLAPEPHAHSIATAISAALGRPEVAPEGAHLDLRAGVLGLPAPERRPAPPASRSFPIGGYTALRARSADALRERLLILDHGPLGYAYTAGHGHADALSVWLHVDGEPVLVDTGTYRYNRDRGWRDHIRSTAAHCTVEVDGRSQSLPTGRFNWGHRARAHRTYVKLSPRGGAVAGAHDGYGDVRHRREVHLDGLDSAQVEDALEASSRSVDVRAFWHFAPGLNLEPDGERAWTVYRQDRPLLRVEVHGAPLVGRILAPDTAPDTPDGLNALATRAPHVGALVPATTLLLTGRLSLPASWTTRFVFLSPDARLPNPSGAAMVAPGPAGADR